MTVCTAAMWGMLGWIVFLAFASIRVQSALHRQALDVDIFDLSPFEPIGRNSLMVCLVFVGGTTIGLLLGFSREDFLDWRNLLAYGMWIPIIILLFFANMWRTHGVLSAAKGEALAEAQREISRAYRELQALPMNPANTHAVTAEVGAWIQVEQRVRRTRTWPYNTEMLRALFVSILVPLFAALVRLGAIVLGN